ncbi:NmrA family NAD(P)-binding protein [Caballeronia sp. LZ001]|uniref:NmrA family NAD(P)-binding protein n=1 Tax=Caballeronia sp. LZ001 TaxID=3038553 RepID=UPI002855A130|nr:NmrA family NAD(P)-binding protein [Caballeronia sp. LZ001]MDR5806571.1 NmrA family NAD(P)-binding protein [Caballeronia sp. LZ001]
MAQTVLVVGATGMLGGRIAHHLLQDHVSSVRVLVRRSTDGNKRSAVDALSRAGAEVVEGDLAIPASLERATQGVDVVVSAVQGGPATIVDGQLALAEAAKRNGVRRILPSDFGLDLFKATPGEHAAFNWRASVDEKISSLGLEHIHMLQGGFMDLFGPVSPLVNYEKHTVHFWGDGKRPIEVTSVEDTARMTARVALDRTVPSGKFAFSGDRISFQEVADEAERQTGHAFTRHSLGTESELRAAMAKADPGEAIMLAYQLYMLNGQTSLEDLKNDHYPDLRMLPFAEFLRQRLGGR